MPRLIFDSSADFSDVADAMCSFQREVCGEVSHVGAEAISLAQQNGNFHDVSGHLRTSYRYDVQTDGTLVLENTAEYASDVEARGFEVLSTRALMAEKDLKDIFE